MSQQSHSRNDHILVKNTRESSFADRNKDKKKNQRIINIAKRGSEAFRKMIKNGIFII